MFAVQVPAPELVDGVRRRANALIPFYAPLGLRHFSSDAVGDSVLVGALARSAQPASEPLRTWGEPLPAQLASAGALFEASDAQLRAISGMTAAVAVVGARARVVGGASGPATLYAAEHDGVFACATHAVAAAVLAGLDPIVDPEAVALHVAFDCVPGRRTLIEGVEALAPATSIVLDGARRAVTCYWPLAERWELVAEADAYAQAEGALLDSASARLGGDRRPAIALTAGLDSTVAAAAVHEAGIDAAAFTWGDPAWPDSVGALETAARLGLSHEMFSTGVLSAAGALAQIDADARWTDGVTALEGSERIWPADADAIVVGMGGETGRAFHYDAWAAVSNPEPDPAELARRFSVRARLAGADHAAVELGERAAASWVDEALAAQVEGWRVLDVVYSEQRVRRWGRSRVPCAAFDYIPFFTAPEVQRGLASLPLGDRLRSGFHRRFLDERGLAAPPAPPLPQISGPLGRALRRPLDALRRRTRPPALDEVDEFAKLIWDERPEARDWLVEEALRDPLISGVLGDGWARHVGAGFREGRRHASERARLAAGPVALKRALTDVKTVQAAL